MAVFTRVKTWVSNEVLTASDLNGEFNNLLNNTIPASIEDYSADVSTMQTTADPGGVGTESLATTLAGELARIRYAIKRIAGGAQWYTAPVVTLGSTISTADIEDLAVTQPKLALNAVDTGNITNASVTKAKLVAVGQQVSASSGVYTQTTTGTFQDVTNLTVTITTTGRPVFVGIVNADSTNAMRLEATRSNDTIDAEISIIREATVVEYRKIYFNATSAPTIQMTFPAPSVIDVVAAGTYTYKVQTKLVTTLNSPSLLLYHAKLVAYEL